MRNSVRAYWIAAILLLFSLSAVTGADPPDVAPVSLNTEQLLGLQVDVFAKGLSQKKPVYIKHVLSSFVHVNNAELPRDSVISRLLEEFGGLLFDFPRMKKKPMEGKHDGEGKSTSIQISGEDQALATLRIRPVQTAGKLTKQRVPPTTLVVGFRKTNGLWKIAALEWEER